MSAGLAHALERVADLLASQVVGALLQLAISWASGGN